MNVEPYIRVPSVIDCRSQSYWAAPVEMVMKPWGESMPIAAPFIICPESAA